MIRKEALQPQEALPTGRWASLRDLAGEVRTSGFYGHSGGRTTEVVEPVDMLHRLQEWHKTAGVLFQAVPTPFDAPSRILKLASASILPAATGSPQMAEAAPRAPVVGPLLSTKGQTSSILRGLEAHGWKSIAKRLENINHALEEDFDRMIDIRSLQTLDRVLRNAPSIPHPNLSASEEGRLSGIWSLGDAGGVVASEFLLDGTVGCAAVWNAVEGRSYSATISVDQTCTLLSWLSKLELLKRR